MRTVLFPIFPGAEELDLAGPWEALALARDYGERDVELFPAALTREPVKLLGGLRVVPDYAFGSDPQADAIVVPGGPGTRDESAWRPVVAWVSARRYRTLSAKLEHVRRNAKPATTATRLLCRRRCFRRTYRPESRLASMGSPAR